MAYQRRSPVFSFMGVDRIPRSVALVNDEDEHAAQIGKPRSDRSVNEGTVSLLAKEFAAQRRRLQMRMD